MTDPNLPNPPLPYAPSAPTRGNGTRIALGVISILIALGGGFSSLMAIVQVAVFGLVGTPSGTVVATSGPAAGPMTGPATGPAVAAAPLMLQKSISTSTMATSIIAESLNLILAVLLLVAAIQLLRSRPSGVRLHLLWAWLKLPMAVLLSVAQYFLMKEMLNSMMADLQQPAGFEGMVAIASAVMGGIMGLLYPITLLIMLNIRSVRRNLEPAPLPA